MLGVNANHWFHSWRPDVMWVSEAREIIKALPDEAWSRASVGHGTRGERLCASLPWFRASPDASLKRSVNRHKSVTGPKAVVLRLIRC
ncbi:hypothetical protein NCH01_14050 [Neoasaia chiangmaiensis]|nr:hypothetical protein NCH01_14050 [Neoasaia chiangmaiensis]